MKISTRGRYALRMLADMAQHQSDGWVALKDVAARQEISKKYLEQIALTLSLAGVLQGCRGHQGGYRLLVDPAQCTALDILTLVEGSMAPVSCMDCAPNTCPRSGDCLTLPLWQELDRRVRSYLGTVTIADIVAGRVQAGGEV